MKVYFSQCEHVDVYRVNIGVAQNHVGHMCVIQSYRTRMGVLYQINKVPMSDAVFCEYKLLRLLATRVAT